MFWVYLSEIFGSTLMCAQFLVVWKGIKRRNPGNDHRRDAREEPCIRTFLFRVMRDTAWHWVHVTAWHSWHRHLMHFVTVRGKWYQNMKTFRSSNYHETVATHPPAPQVIFELATGIRWQQYRGILTIWDFTKKYLIDLCLNFNAS